MYFPVADIHVHPLLPVIVAFVISFFTSMGGVSGAFLLLPFQVSALGFVSPAVSATNHLFNIVAIPGGVYRYAREGRMVWPLAGAVIVGTLPGVLLGAIIRIRYLPDPTRFKLFAGLVLLSIGGRLLLDLWQKRGKEATAVEAHFDPPPLEEKAAVVVSQFNWRRSAWPRIVYSFEGTTYRVNSLALMALSLAVGIVGGVYGIGGGAIIAPFFIAYFGLPVYTVAGAALLGTLVTSVVAVLFYQFLAPFYPGTAVAPDWALGFLFGVGGLAGMYSGARAQKYVPARWIKGMLFLCTAGLGAGYLFNLF